jgi:hypothetical protein
LSDWKDLGSVLDSITRYSGLVGNVNPDNVQMMLHRAAQQQLPLQRPISIGRLMRYVHLYLNPEVATLLQRSLDITAREFTFLGIATYTQIAKSPRFVTGVDLTSLGISDEARDKFYTRMTSTLTSIRASLKNYAKFDHTWDYTFNPISDRPLINVDPSPWPDGSAIELEDRDIQISVHGLLTAILPAMLPSRSVEAIFASRGGQATSRAKRKSSRANGRKGGRPRKKTSTEVV